MGQSAVELVEQHDLDAAVIEALLVRYGDLKLDNMATLDGEQELVYRWLESDDDQPVRRAEDHYYQFERSELRDDSSAPETEPEFEEILETLVAEGLVAKAEDRPLYSTSFYDILTELGPDFTASEIDDLCASTGMSKRQVYYHIFTNLHLNVNLTA